MSPNLEKGKTVSDASGTQRVLPLGPRTALVRERPLLHRLLGAPTLHGTDVAAVGQPLAHAQGFVRHEAERILQLTGLQGTPRKSEHAEHTFMRSRQGLIASRT